MIIYANIQSNLSISFREEDFQRTNMHYYRKNSNTPLGASLFTEQVCFSNFGKGSLDDHLSRSTVKSAH